MDEAGWAELTKSGTRSGVARSTAATEAHGPPRRSRLGLVVGVFLIGLSASLSSYLAAREGDKRYRQAAFESRAQDASSDVFRHFEIPLEVALTLPSLMKAFPSASHQEFTRFASPSLERHPGIAALEWVPRVTREDRAEYERRVGEIWEQNREGQRIRSPDRQELFPLTYIVPDAPALRGLEIAFDEGRRAIVERAAKSGKPTLSEPFRLVEDPDGMMSVSIVTSVPALEPTQGGATGTLGFAVCLFRLQPVVEEALLARNLKDLSYSLFDDTDPDHPILLATNRRGASAAEDAFRWEKTVGFVDRNWRVSWTGASAAGGAGSSSVWILGVGFVLSALVAASVFLFSALRGARMRAAEAARMGSYTLTRRIGAGGMGVVYEAEHSLLRRRTAIKLIREDAATAISLERFEREAQSTSRLTHPNTVQLFDFGRTPGGIFYYAMEYIDGVTLRDLVEVSGPLPPARALHLMKQAAGSLAEAHDLGMVHRDLKPDNMMVCVRGGIPDCVKVLDFGLVKNRSFDQRRFITHEHAMVGTPEYMAPEAFSGGADLTAASDVYGLGSILYFLLTGAPPHTAPTLMALVARVTTTEAVPLQSSPGLSISEDLSSLVMACLSRTIDSRPPSAREFLQALESLSDCQPWTSDEAKSFWIDWGPKFEGHSLAKNEPVLSEETAQIDGAPTRRHAG